MSSFSNLTNQKAGVADWYQKRFFKIWCSCCIKIWAVSFLSVISHEYMSHNLLLFKYRNPVQVLTYSGWICLNVTSFCRLDDCAAFLMYENNLSVLKRKMWRNCSWARKKMQYHVYRKQNGTIISLLGRNEEILI